MRRRFNQWREQRLLARHPIAEADWHHALAHCAPARRLAATDRARLRVLATRFLRAKAIEPAQGLLLDTRDHTLLATHACVPILNLGLDWYRGWHSLIVYPEAFIPRRERMDAAGVVHASAAALAGEAWQRGPVILSWGDITPIRQRPGHNVVIHELAHKLDMLDGGANGQPPLHRDMDRQLWHRVFTAAWNRLWDAHHDGRELPIDPYALENPAEFFAVTSEQFFEAPANLQAHLPEVHAQLARFYRQHPVGDGLRLVQG